MTVDPEPRGLVLKPHEVKALDAGTLTQLRRVYRAPKNPFDNILDGGDHVPAARRMLGSVGTVFWVKENFWQVPGIAVPKNAYSVEGSIHPGAAGYEHRVMYVAQGIRPLRYYAPYGKPYTLDPPMPGVECFNIPWPTPLWSASQMWQGWSRFRLRITELRVQRLQEITADDLVREGYVGDLEGFICRWNKIYQRKDSQDAAWSTNPQTWVANFEVLEHVRFPVLAQKESR